MPTSERDQSGRYKAEHTDEDVIAAIRAHSPAATSEVADDLGIARQSADYRLQKLANAGQVNHKMVGGSAVWTLPGGDS